MKIFASDVYGILTSMSYERIPITILCIQFNVFNSQVGSVWTSSIYRLAIVNAHTDLTLTFYLRQGNHCLAIGEVCVKAFLSYLDLDISYIYMYLLSLPIVLFMNTEVE